MNETCDRCGPAVRAAYRAVRGGQLYLCQHCTAQPRAQGARLDPLASRTPFAQRTSRSVTAAAG